MRGFFAFLFLLVPAAFPQTPAETPQDRVLYIIHTPGPQQRQEIINTVRGIADIAQITPDDAQNSITVRGTAGQLDLAGWLVSELDQAQPAPAHAASHDYLAGARGFTAVRIFCLGRQESPRYLQELVNTLRIAGDIQRVFPQMATASIAIRATPEQAMLAEWVVAQAARSQEAVAQRLPVAAYDMAGDANPAVRTIRLAHLTPPREVQETVNAIRGIADVQRIVPLSATIFLRSTPEGAALAQWIAEQLDSPHDPQKPARVSYEFRDDTPAAATAVRIHWLRNIQNPQQFQEEINLLRAIADLNRIMPRVRDSAIVFRGTPAQAALAEWLIGQLETAGAAEARRTASYNYSADTRGGTSVKICYLKPETTPQSIAEIIGTVRQKAEIQRVMGISQGSAIAFRATPDQAAFAERLIREQDSPEPR